MKKIVSFDFDGTLHLDVRRGHPIKEEDPNPTPNEPVIKALKDEAKRHDIVIVTHRDPYSKSVIDGFVKWQKLPVKEIIFSGPSKVDELEAIGAIRHYDDSWAVMDDFANKESRGIDLIVVKGSKMLKAEPPYYLNPFDLVDEQENHAPIGFVDECVGDLTGKRGSKKNISEVLFSVDPDGQVESYFARRVRLTPSSKDRQ